MKFLVVTAALLISGLSQGALEFEVTKPTIRAVPECGVLNYKEKSDHPSCGISSYKFGRGAACGIASYKTESHELCGVELYKQGSGGPCGYNEIVEKKCIVKNPISGGCSVFGDEVVNKRGKVCRHKDFGPERFNRCARPEFGTNYKYCRNPAFGTNYNTCRLPEFGVESYKNCTIYKTTAELDIYLASTTPYLELNAINMAKAQTSYLFGSGQKKQASCLITRWEYDPLYSDVVEDMKNTYAASFGEEYDDMQFDCDDTEMSSDLVYEGRSCSQFTSQEVQDSLKSGMLSKAETFFFNTCQDMKLYQTYHKWFTNNIKEVNNLLNDLVAMTSPGHKEKLEKLAEQLAEIGLGDEEDSMDSDAIDMRYVIAKMTSNDDDDDDIKDNSILSMEDLGDDMTINKGHSLSEDMLDLIEENAVPVTMTCKWASRPYVYQIQDGVAFINKGKTSVNIYSYDMVHSRGCKTQDIDRPIKVKKLKAYKNIKSLSSLGFDKNSRKNLTGEDDPFWEIVRKHSRRIVQDCSWASRPRVYQFKDYVVYLDANRTNFNIFSNETVISKGCKVPSFD